MPASSSSQLSCFPLGSESSPHGGAHSPQLAPKSKKVNRGKRNELVVQVRLSTTRPSPSRQIPEQASGCSPSRMNMTARWPGLGIRSSSRRCPFHVINRRANLRSCAPPTDWLHHPRPILHLRALASHLSFLRRLFSPCYK